LLYDGYDWATTRKTIEHEVKEMRRRLAKIRQLVASGQTQDPDIEEETSALLFNSVYIGLEQDVEGLEPAALVAAIDEELNDDLESASQSSWQSLKPSLGGKLRGRSTRLHAKRLTRSRVPSIEFCLTGVDAEVDRYRQEQSLVSRTFAVVKDLEILDHIKTSTWKKFLTELRSDSRGNVRETDSHMVQVELRHVRPVPGHPSEEARFRVSPRIRCHALTQTDLKPGQIIASPSVRGPRCSRLLEEILQLQGSSRSDLIRFQV
jgi:autophagy-related protein 2